jgi:hypothetical protein
VWGGGCFYPHREVYLKATFKIKSAIFGTLFDQFLRFSQIRRESWSNLLKIFPSPTFSVFKSTGIMLAENVLKTCINSFFTPTCKIKYEKSNFLACMQYNYNNQMITSFKLPFPSNEVSLRKQDMTIRTELIILSD